MIHEDQLNINSTDSKLLFDIRSEIRTTNELLTKQLEVLCAIAKHTERKEEVKPKSDKQLKPRSTTAKSRQEKPKRGSKVAKNK